MSDIKSSALDLIGNTPLMKISRFLKDENVNVFAKLEYLNPAGSVKAQKYVRDVLRALGQGGLYIP